MKLQDSQMCVLCVERGGEGKLVQLPHLDTTVGESRWATF
jgi:hypothetical protein